jgi:hypothetical protein
MIVRMSRVCHRIERGETWESAAMLAEDALVTHGSCPACFAETLAEVEGLIGGMAMEAVSGSGWSNVRGHWG